MKILLVTSEVTFLPENYLSFLESAFTELKELQAEKKIDLELVVLKNNSFTHIAQGTLLCLIGARRIGFNLIKNSLQNYLPFVSKEREKLAQKFNIKMHYFTGPNEPDFRYFVESRKIDLIINARTRFIYKNRILKLPKIGAINIHHGLLPEYRGIMCDLWALFKDRATGFTIHIMDSKIDNGAIIKKVETTLPHETEKRLNFSTLISESAKIEGIEIANTVKSILQNGKIVIQEKNYSPNPTYTKTPDFKTVRKMLQKGLKL